MITAKNMNIWVGKRELLHSLNFTVNPQNRVALVGANGSGKTTLINTFKQSPEQRKLNFGDSLEIAPVRLAWVEQEVPALEMGALEYVTLGDSNYAYWKEQLAKALETNDADLIARANSHLDEIDAWTIDSRAAIIMMGLGFTADKLHQPVKELSGGWRIRLNLARALLLPSDLLLLDEPTNHLDIDAIYWLEEYLKRYQGTIVFISHDQEFMDNLADHVLHISNNTIESYTGNYSSFTEQRKVKLEIQAAQYEQQQKYINHVQKFINRFRYKDSKARQAQSRIKMLEKLERIDPVVTGSPFSFSFQDGGRLPAVIATLRNVSLGYHSGQPVLEKVNFSLHPGMRFGLLGLNGAGKSTLIKAFAGELGTLDGKGSIELNPLVKLGYFNQYVVDKLDLNATPVELMRRLDPKLLEPEIRTFLGGFNFSNDKVFEKVENFSGGEKSRLALALIVYEKPNLLLLDEPTNHLDLEMRQALANALLAFNGTLIVVSHDRFLLASIVDEFYLVNNGRVEPFEGDLNDYHSWVVKSKALAKEEAREEKQAQERAQAQADQDEDASNQNSLTLLEQKRVIFNQDTRLQRELKRKLLPLTQQQAKLNDANEKAQAEIASIHHLYLDPEVANDGQKIIELSSRERELQKEVEAREEEWLELEMEVEAETEAFILENVK